MPIHYVFIQLNIVNKNLISFIDDKDSPQFDVVFFIGCNEISWLFKNSSDIKKLYNKVHDNGIIINYET